jgi:hypothetical protein
MIRGIFIIIMFVLLFLPSNSDGDNNPYLLYQKVISGKINFEELSPEQQFQVIEIHKALKRNRCPGCSRECRDAKEDAESHRSELEGYVKRLYRCVEDNDLKNDCSSEFRRVKSAYSDFESAVSNVGSNCD